MLRGSLVPSPLIQELRTYSREYRILVNQRTKVLTQMDRVLVMCGIRLSSCISNIDSKSFMQVVEALIRGETNPDRLTSLVYANGKNKESGKLRECLTGHMKAHHRLKLTTYKQPFDLLVGYFCGGYVFGNQTQPRLQSDQGYLPCLPSL